MTAADVVIAYAKAYAQGDPESLAVLFADDYTDANPMVGDGPRGVVEHARMLHQAIADLQVDISHLLADDSTVMARIVWSGTHQGSFMGVEGSGRAVSMTTMDLFGVHDGKIVTHDGIADVPGLLQQLRGADTNTGVT
jgi:steroid delta-isomerase-like uncharacterized protein